MSRITRGLRQLLIASQGVGTIRIGYHRFGNAVVFHFAQAYR